MKYRFMDDHRSIFRLEKMCRVLEVSRSGYYAWRKRPKSQRRIKNELLLDNIQSVHQKSRQRYGSYRIWRALLQLGVRCGRNRVVRLMRHAGLKSRRSRKFKATTNSKHNLPVAPNLLNQNFKTTAPNQVWVSDITYIGTWEGWVYLAVIIDLYSRQVIGWAISSRINQELVLSALRQALGRRQILPGLIFHSDRGSQYAAHKVRQLLEKHKILQSMSKKGDCYDNAVAESFFATLKLELVYPDFFQTREAAYLQIFEFIEIFYNRQRIHSTINYAVPSQFEIPNLVA